MNLNFRNENEEDVNVNDVNIVCDREAGVERIN